MKKLSNVKFLFNVDIANIEKSQMFSPKRLKVTKRVSILHMNLFKHPMQSKIYLIFLMKGRIKIMKSADSSDRKCNINEMLPIKGKVNVAFTRAKDKVF